MIKNNYLKTFHSNRLFLKVNPLKANFLRLIILLSFDIFIGHLFQFIAPYFIDNYGRNPSLIGQSITYSFFLSVIIGPLVETIIYQYIIFKLTFYFFNKNTINIISAILISALAFSLSHNFNYFAILNSFFGGIILGYAYFFNYNRHFPPFWYVFLLHSLHNLYAFIINN